MRISSTDAYFLLQKNPPLRKRELAYLRFTVQRVPPKEMMERLFFEDITSVYQTDKRIFKECKTLLDEILAENKLGSLQITSK